MMANHLARPGLLEPFGRTLMCLQLGHWIFQDSTGVTVDFHSVARLVAGD
jgi:hypothetical protein